MRPQHLHLQPVNPLALQLLPLVVHFNLPLSPECLLHTLLSLLPQPILHIDQLPAAPRLFLLGNSHTIPLNTAPFHHHFSTLVTNSNSASPHSNNNLPLPRLALL